MMTTKASFLSSIHFQTVFMRISLVPSKNVNSDKLKVIAILKVYGYAMCNDIRFYTP